MFIFNISKITEVIIQIYKIISSWVNRIFLQIDFNGNKKSNQHFCQSYFIRYRDSNDIFYLSISGYFRKTEIIFTVHVTRVHESQFLAVNNWLYVQNSPCFRSLCNTQVKHYYLLFPGYIVSISSIAVAIIKTFFQNYYPR